MKKTQLNLTIDNDIYLKIKLLDENISKLVNDFLRNYINSNVEDQDIVDLENNKQDLLKEKKIIEEKLMSILADIERVKSEKKKSHEERMNKIKSMKPAINEYMKEISDTM